MWDLALKSAGTIPTSARFAVDWQHRVCVDRLLLSHRLIVMVDGQLRVFIILSPKCTKITIFLQITPKPENILKGLQKNYKVFKNTYIPWLKMNKIHGISTPPDLLFCLSSRNTASSLFERCFWNIMDSHNLRIHYHHLNNIPTTSNKSQLLEILYMQYPSLATNSIHPTS